MSVAVYRMYDQAGDLLYVGQSQDLGLRVQIHSSIQPWFAEVTRIDVTHTATRAAAVELERTAIETESPRYNITHHRRNGVGVFGRPRGFYIDSEAVRRRLIDLRRTQTWLAEQSEVSPTFLSNLLHGRRASIEFAERIARALEVHVGDIFPDLRNAA